MAKPGKAVGNKFHAAVLRKLGAPVSPRNLRLMRAWQRAEGTQATWNPLATTHGPGSSFNQVGVKNIPSFQAGVQATYETLINGHYPNIVRSLKQNRPPQETAREIANSPWGTGEGVLRTLGATTVGRVPSAAGAGTTPRPGKTPRAGKDPAAVAFNQQLVTQRKMLGLQLLTLASASDLDYQGIASTVQMLTRMPAAMKAKPPKPGTLPTREPSAAGAGAKMYTGKGLQLPRVGSFSITHQTDGLPGYPAHDFMAPAGTPVYAPYSGTVTRLSGHPGGTAGGAAGRSIYLKGGGGISFLTHFDYDRTVVKAGQKIRKGQLIGYVMAYPGGANHIHWGFHSTGQPYAH